MTVDYRVMMESSPDAILLLDLDIGQLVHANSKAASLFRHARRHLADHVAARFVSRRPAQRHRLIHAVRR
ncbi:PAS domain-containing protein [Massilia sp. B-10]|nr:PAS domain-containing protein [Massilia sp. B-10]